VKFGISTFITDEGIGAGPLAAAVEQRGFNSLCVTEHSHIPVAPKEPVPAGRQVPRVDVVSRGRLNVGVGVGWNLDEMRNHGTTPATRGDKMNEQLAALKQIWNRSGRKTRLSSTAASSISTRSSPGRSPFSGRIPRSTSAVRAAPPWNGYGRLATVGYPGPPPLPKSYARFVSA
jgi:hypothetical protein